MAETMRQARGLYFEDYEIGQKLETAGRTITEADIVNFAGVSGDFNRIHTDAEYARAGMFGRRVAHGVLVVSAVTGLIVQTGIMEDTVLAFRELDWKFSRPVMIGDTIRARVEVTETKLVRRLGGGNVVTKVSVLNQDDQVVQRGHMTLLVMSKEL